MFFIVSYFPSIDGALKGYNVYYQQAIEFSTVAHNFTVNSPEECALACFKAPFLCPGFDLYIPSSLSPEPAMTEGMEKGVRGTDEDDNAEEDEMGNEEEDGMTTTMPMPMMVCKLADTKSRVHHVNKTKDEMTSAMGMGDRTASGVKHFHFKLPRHAPLTGGVSFLFFALIDAL